MTHRKAETDLRDGILRTRHLAARSLTRAEEQLSRLDGKCWQHIAEVEAAAAKLDALMDAYSFPRCSAIPKGRPQGLEGATATDQLRMACDLPK